MDTSGKENAKSFIIGPQPGCNVELSKLMEAGKLLLEMGYIVNRKKIARPGQKTLLNVLEIQEPEEGDKQKTGGKINAD